MPNKNAPEPNYKHYFIFALDPEDVVRLTHDVSQIIGAPALREPTWLRLQPRGSDPSAGLAVIRPDMNITLINFSIPIPRKSYK
jgi:hypothetical protein